MARFKDLRQQQPPSTGREAPKLTPAEQAARKRAIAAFDQFTAEELPETETVRIVKEFDLPDDK